MYLCYQELSCTSITYPASGPILAKSGTPGNFVTKKPPVVTFANQFSFYVQFTESYNGVPCPVIGTVQVQDFVGSSTSSPVISNYTISSSGGILYQTTPGIPLMIYPFLKKIEFTATRILNGHSDSVVFLQEFLVKGQQALSMFNMVQNNFVATSFVTKSPNFPLMIIWDPPGGNSFTSVVKDYSTSLDISFSGETTSGFSGKGYIYFGYAGSSLFGSMEYFQGLDSEYAFTQCVLCCCLVIFQGLFGQIRLPL